MVRPPCRAPDGLLCHSRVKQENWGGFAEKYTHPINAKAPKRGLHYRRICTAVVSGSRGEGGWGQSPGGRNATRRDQDVSESYESQSPVLPGMHRAGVGLRRMEVVCSAQSEADGGMVGPLELATNLPQSFHNHRKSLGLLLVESA